MVACLQDHSNDLLADLSSSYTICLDDFPLTAGDRPCPQRLSRLPIPTPFHPTPFTVLELSV